MITKMIKRSKTWINGLSLIHGLLFVSGIGTLCSCSDFLEITPQETIVLDKFWNEEADVENIVAGCYSALQGD